MVRPIVRVHRSVYRITGDDRGERAIPEETAVAFTFNTASYAVMMATPQDLEDFAIGFSLTEGVTSSSDAIESVEIVEEDVGIELRIWLKAPHAAEFSGRRRKMAGDKPVCAGDQHDRSIVFHGRFRRHLTQTPARHP